MMLPRFRQMVENLIQFEWPSSSGFGNAFKYLWEQYLDNVKTNLKTHCESRLRKFFRMRVFELNDYANNFNYFNDIFGEADALPYYDEIDVKNAVNYTYSRKDTTRGDLQRQLRLGELLDELRFVGAPDDCNIKDFVENNWFESLRMWIEIQRDIRFFHIAFADRRDKPRLKNFACIPMCSFQRRHIRIDTSALFTILSKVNLLPQKCGARKKKDGDINWVNIKQKEFLQNHMGSWNICFDLEKINGLVHNKREFNCQIVSDGVSATIVYKKPKATCIELSDEEVLEMYTSGQFPYELGIDPGERTYNATVRRCTITGEEVIMTFLFHKFE